jgi:hypothetical protein
MDMNAHIRLAYQKTRQRTIGQIEAEIMEAEANLLRATRGTFAEEYAETRLQRLKTELARFGKRKETAQ